MLNTAMIIFFEVAISPESMFDELQSFAHYCFVYKMDLWLTMSTGNMADLLAQ
jgi:hypothetical protein